MTDSANLSLADFYAPETDDPLLPSPEYTRWRRDSTWATSLYEPSLLGAPAPRVEILRAGKRRSVVNLTSYNYMGMVNDPEVVRAAREALVRYGTGACGSPLLSGLADLHVRLEEELSSFMGREATMLFNSGFGGAMGALAGLLRKGDVAVMDAKCHLSLIAGATLGHARIQFFEHNDPASLDETLSKLQGKRKLVVVEGIYSMDGDMADLPALLEVSERHGCGLFIDEAHSILAWGAAGRGATEHFGVESRVGLVFATFSKAFAGVGGFVSGRRETIEYLRYYSHPYGFSCALPPATVAGLLKVLEIIRRENRQEELCAAVPVLGGAAPQHGNGGNGRSGLLSGWTGATRQALSTAPRKLAAALAKDWASLARREGEAILGAFRARATQPAASRTSDVLSSSPVAATGSALRGRSGPARLYGQLERWLERTGERRTRRQRLQENTRYFRERLLQMGVNLGQSTTQVIPIIIGSDRRALYEMCHEMNDGGLFLAPVDYPSVPEDELRYRVAITSAHTRRDLDEALAVIEDVIVRRLRGGHLKR